MMYLNGQIKAVYLGGHYHSEAYLGSILVWGRVKEIPGEAHAQLAFENTADGVAVVLLPGDAVEALAMTANVTAETHGMADGSADETLIVDAQIMPQVHGVANRKATETLEIRPTINESILHTPNGIATQTFEIRPTINESILHTPNGIAINDLLLQTSILGRDIIINKKKITELLELHTPILPAVGVVFNPIAPGCILAMETTIPSGMAAVLNPIKFGSELMLTLPVPPATEAVLKDSQAKLALQFKSNVPSVEPVEVVKCVANGEEQIQTTADGLPVFSMDGDATSEMEMRGTAQPEALEVAPQEATDNLKLHFAAEWTRGVGEKSSEDCEITAQAIGYAQMGDTVLIGIEGNQILQLTASVVGTAEEPVVETARAAQYIEGTLEEINLDDWPNGITEIPNNTIIMQHCLKNVAIPTSVKVIGELVLNSCHVETVMFGDASKLTIKPAFVSETIRQAMILSDDGFDLDFPKFFDNTVVDFSALRFVPTFIANESSGVFAGFELAKEIRVKKSLVSGWKSLSVLTDDAKNKIVGV